ncbi:MAG: electron transfer flavoprotein subunit alpha/FixB family protein, partial [Desulfobulbaceae bacterium]|nr:electron transfer flavoprotein subunit alpha/FixB family protein [Desulfobulbaceae bacterium]
LVFLEQREGAVKKASLEAWQRVRELAASTEGTEVCGILAGPADTGHIEGCLDGEGMVYHAVQEEFRFYNPERYSRLVAETMQREGIASLFFADTALSRDLAPRLSVRLQASLLSGSPELHPDRLSGGCVRTVYSGSAMALFEPEREIRIHILPSRGTVTFSPSGGKITFIALEPRNDAFGEFFPVVRRIVMRRGSPDVAEAGIIVAGGRGTGGAEGFALLEQLAFLLGGAVGASRGVVDAGWRPHAEQIGQTGKTVAPALYIACGISGAVQHLAGIASAGTVVAINSDPHAPLFDVADYGIAGDLHLVLPKLIDALREFLKSK